MADWARPELEAETWQMIGKFRSFLQLIVETLTYTKARVCMLETSKGTRKGVNDRRNLTSAISLSVEGNQRIATFAV